MKTTKEQMQQLSDAALAFNEALKGSGFHLRDFGGGITVMPMPDSKSQGWTVAQAVVIERD